jgi:hypothetical protein
MTKTLLLLAGTAAAIFPIALLVVVIKYRTGRRLLDIFNEVIRSPGGYIKYGWPSMVLFCSLYSE